jgi:hypothetical protein
VTPKTTEPNPQGLEREVGLEKPAPVTLLEPEAELATVEALLARGVRRPMAPYC